MPQPISHMCHRYIPLNSTVTGAANLPNFEDTSVFALSGFQYIIMAVVLTKGYPYKKALYANGKKHPMADLFLWTHRCVFLVFGILAGFILVVFAKFCPWCPVHLVSLGPVLFVLLLLLFFGAMSWLVLYPVPFLRRLFKLSEVTDMNYKLLLVALAALNLFTCYLLEVSNIFACYPISLRLGCIKIF